MDRLITRFAITLAALLTASIVVLVAIGFLCFGLYLALLELMSAKMAAVSTGLAALVLAALVFFGGRAIYALARHKHNAAPGENGRPKTDPGRIAAEIGDLVGGEFAALAAKHPQTTVIASLLSGFAVGASPGLRRALRDLLLKK